jgi:hypothetical protein
MDSGIRGERNDKETWSRKQKMWKFIKEEVRWMRKKHERNQETHKILDCLQLLFHIGADIELRMKISTSYLCIICLSSIIRRDKNILHGQKNVILKELSRVCIIFSSKR